MMTNTQLHLGAFSYGAASLRSIRLPSLPFHLRHDRALPGLQFLSYFPSKGFHKLWTIPKSFKMNKLNHKEVDIVIIGAGASGLQCAANLLASSNTDGAMGRKPSVMILEARNRIGGRIYTATETKTKLSNNEIISFPRDLGAAWVHGTGLESGDIDDQNPMVRLLEKTTPEGHSVVDYHLDPIFKGNCWTRPDTVLHKAGTIALFRRGERIRNDSPWVKVSIERHYEVQREIAKRGSHLYEIGEGMQTVITPVAQIRSRVSESLHADDEKDESSVVGDLVPFYAFLNENWNGISEDDLQLGFVELPVEPMRTDERYVDEGDFEGPHCKLKHGMEKVIKPLYDEVADHVHLEEQVVRISRLGNQSLRIETKSGMTVQSKSCITTIPVGCLQRDVKTLFQPPLNIETVEAINSLATGYYKKVFLTFDEIFWPIEEPMLGLVRSADQADEIGRYLLVYNFLAKDSIPCLEAILCGNSGKWAVSKSDDEIRDAILTFIEDAMAVPDLTNKCVACHITRWEEDPFTRGAYSSFRLGTLERHVDVLTQPKWDGDLIIAGEFTESDDMGSVQAALYSGERAAAQALEKLSRIASQSTHGKENCTNILSNPESAHDRGNAAMLA